ncbi:MAG: TonB-dependent receptor [Sphingomonadales bacterium]|nr:TonB-dependent receptor [Sphingomonadales bacterium]
MISARLTLPLLLAGSMLNGVSAMAQVAPASADDQSHPEDSGETIVVVGRLISGNRDAIAAPVVLQGDKLAADMRPQIGEMLASLPGVSTSAFAPGVSRPVLRGFDGPRAQLLIDGLGSLDASSVSADHASSLDTLNVERIDVLHGPQVLLYASDPAGGVVNAIDKRIPRKVPDQAISMDAMATYGTAADSLESGAAVQVRLAPRLVAHLDAAYNHSNDLRVAGYVLSPELRARTFDDANARLAVDDIAGAMALTAQAEARGRIANSGAESWTLGAGLAFIDDGGDIGISVQRYANDYKIPPRPEPVPENSAISLRQTRVDLRAGVNPDGFFKRLELRAAFGDYRHVEIAGGVPGTLFQSKAIEARFEAVQAHRGNWSGSSGLQYGASNLDVSGDPLLPNTASNRFAAYTLQTLRIGQFDVEAAVRYERATVRDRTHGTARGFDLLAGVAGLAWHPDGAFSASISVSRGERAPSAEELFIDGVHDATQSYERGNSAFSIERSKGVEAGVNYAAGGVNLALTAYATDFDDFITPVATGQIIDGFPVYQYVQAPARFRGVEAEGSARLAQLGAGTVTLDGGLDYVHAQLTGRGPVPHIPPLRLRGGLDYAAPGFSLRGEVEWNARQSRVTVNENQTAAFTVVNLNASWKPLGDHGPLTLMLAADNLLNVTGRHSTSETRDFVPISGRDIRLTAKLSI